MITLRPYQQEAKDCIYKAFKERGIKSQLIVIPTGGGKRLMSIDIACHFKKVLFICHREELIIQAFNEFEKIMPFQTGIIKAERFDIDKRFVVASIQTLFNRLNRIDAECFDHIIVDECHHFASKTWVAPLHYFKPRLMIGYTATDKRLDGLNLANVFEEKVYEFPIEECIKQGYLAKPEAYKIQTMIDISKLHKIAGDFNQKELSASVNIPTRNHFIVNKWEELTKKEPTIAYCIDIKHCVDLKEIFEHHGYSPAIIVSDKTITPNRDETLNRFKTGELNPLINCEILTEGLDINDVGVIIHARPTMSETLYKQITGRVLRLKSDAFFEKYGHRTGIILDFVDNCGKHSLVNSTTLEKHKPLEDRIFLNTSEKEQRIKDIAEKKERDRKIANLYKETTKVNLLKLPEVTVWDSARMEEPATQAQLDWLIRLGVYDPDAEYTKKQASEFITFSQAAPWQIKKLAQWGYDVSEGVTVGQFQKIKRNLELKERGKIPAPSSNKISF
jgi:superfamily II DNA or RNA helicase